MEAVVKCLLEGPATKKPELKKHIPLQVAAIKLKQIKFCFQFFSLTERGSEESFRPQK